MPDRDGSKRDPSQDKAESVSQAGEALWKMLLRGVSQRGVRKKCRRNNPVDTKVSEGAEGGAPGTRMDFPAICKGSMTMVKQTDPVPWRAMLEQVSTLKPEDPIPQQVNMP